jgi:small subunit ribosomal protein S8
MHTDPIADLLTRIRNALRAHHNETIVPHSKIKEEITKILTERGYVTSYEVVTNGQFKEIKIILDEDKEGLNLKRVSKPGQRIYVKKENLKAIKSGLGISILSTSKGLMSNLEARKQNLGGEILCEIY